MVTAKVDAEVWLRSTFPNLNNEDFDIKSLDTDAYNCIAWAAHDTERWWEPSGDPEHYWPLGLPPIYTLENYVHAFETLGFEICESSRFEAGYEKVAIYVDEDGIPQHMARQLPSSRWTSKLGRVWDIDHQTVHGVEGDTYGMVSQYMRRVQIS
jgi:hypothetical protein